MEEIKITPEESAMLLGGGRQETPGETENVSDSNTKRKLKPCPFCGGEAITFHIPENTPEEMAKHPKWQWRDAGRWVVGCHDDHECMGNFNHKAMVFFDEEDAIEAWNTRV